MDGCRISAHNTLKNLSFLDAACISIGSQEVKFFTILAHSSSVDDLHPFLRNGDKDVFLLFDVCGLSLSVF